MHSLSEFIEAFLVKGEQIFAKRAFSQALAAWDDLKPQEKDEQIRIRSCQWTNEEIEEFLNNCSKDKNITSPTPAKEYFAELAKLKEAGNNEELSKYMERSHMHGELRRICRVLAMETKTRQLQKSRYYIDTFK